jgi:hypothetical protein
MKRQCWQGKKRLCGAHVLTEHKEKLVYKACAYTRLYFLSEVACACMSASCKCDFVYGRHLCQPTLSCMLKVVHYLLSQSVQYIYEFGKTARHAALGNSVRAP